MQFFDHIHFAKKRYRQTYHLHYRHAKKLFFFDLCLLIATVALIVLSVGWLLYSPVISDLVNLRLSGVEGRFKSGDRISFDIKFENISDRALHSLKLSLSLPDNFVLESDDTVFLPNLAPRESGSITATGRYFQTPNLEEKIDARLTYIDDDGNIGERIARSIIVARDSTLTLEAEVADAILANGETPLVITLKNSSDIPLTGISLSLAAKDIKLERTTVSAGEISGNFWNLPALLPLTTAELKSAMATELNDNIDELYYELTPTIALDGKAIAQTTKTLRFKVIHPRAEFSADWDGAPRVKPGTAATLPIIIKNASETTLSDARIAINLAEDIIDQSEAHKLNRGSLANNVLTITKDDYPALREIKSNEQATIAIIMPIRREPRGGTDLTFTPRPRFSARLAEAPAAVYSKIVQVEPLHIGTSARLGASIRYFTPEGDQLGRGPLPPEVGKETKYWIFAEMNNGTSAITEPELKIELDAKIRYTGRASVTEGRLPIFSAASRSVNWTATEILAHENIGVFFEVAVTPDVDDVGSIPLIIKQATFTGNDGWIEMPVRVTAGPLAADLSEDAIGRNAGVAVNE